MMNMSTTSNGSSKSRLEWHCCHPLRYLEDDFPLARPSTISAPKYEGFAHRPRSSRPSHPRNRLSYQAFIVDSNNNPHLFVQADTYQLDKRFRYFVHKSLFVNGAGTTPKDAEGHDACICSLLIDTELPQACCIVFGGFCLM
ncbi:hypothetical protein CYLTODRAFT_225356 [Cylindrobasidium torrendii FP15055 ss-10]|uniref:Uncharacterized protein n=1 Tax=Cylindrobasidium torrendii FP15055 ss-10 TaxID=1314674 RepID=A0A0D7BH95_9AGAR|nr:hypothetical protein CYLTODRAFT_225356 [Cylindrobasidium torrendii FP15055 ss-10]